MLSSVDSERLEAGDAPAGLVAAEPPGRGLSSVGLPALTLAIGLAVTLALLLVARSQYVRDQDRLLKLRVRDAATLLTAALPAREATLASAAELASVTHGNVRRFERYVAPEISGPRHQYASVSLWQLHRLAAGPVAVVGTAPKLTASAAPALFARAARGETLGVLGLLAPPHPSLGYAFVTGDYGVYAENPLPADRRSSLASNSAFYGLDYAVFLGTRQTPARLLVTNVHHLPLPSPSDSQVVPFGDSSLTLAMASRVSLPGTLPRDLPWIIAVVGVLISAAAAVTTLRLTQRRRAAERLAAEVGRMAEEQRTIAQTLQRALLPAELPRARGLEAGARYEPGERGVDVGGDWYDVIRLDPARMLVVVGDVSGRGLRAATTMASLRYAIRAYAADGDSPPVILHKLSRLVDVAESGQLATVLCVLIDTDRRTIGVTSAGHLPPLIVDGGGGRYVDGQPGVPVGVEPGAAYTEREVALPATGTLLAFTDGLVEMRGEAIDQGLERLRGAVVRDDAQLADLLGRLVTEVPGGRSQDDIAIVGVRWTT